MNELQLAVAQSHKKMLPMRVQTAVENQLRGW
jgi:hypothetical protein